jgi:imidazolonepropionase
MKVIKNIGILATMNGPAHDPLGSVQNGQIEIEDGIISYVGQAREIPNRDDNMDFYDAKGCAVLPGLVDCHTHLLFAGSRADEFALRSKGASYAEIMAAGGGIRNTMNAVRSASIESLVGTCLPRIDYMRQHGVTTLEIKSGYGLSVESELRCLQAIRRLGENTPLDIYATCLAAHAVPPEFEENVDGYVDLVCNEILPQAAESNLADGCDVFVERGAFSVEQGRRVLKKGRDLGLDLHIHAEQLSSFGGAQLAADLGVLSAGHLEYCTADDIKSLVRANVVLEVLATAQVFLGMEQRIPGRALVDAGATVAVATDYNPGSANVPNLHLAGGLAVSMSGLSAEEAILGMTRNGAAALGLNDRGILAPGKKADICVLNSASIFDLVYAWGQNHVAQVMKNGEWV